MRLSAQLEIRPGVTAIIGSGGKTTLLHRLAKELSGQGRVVLTTSTHIRPSTQFPCLISPTAEAVAAALRTQPAVCIGSLSPEGKFCACGLSWQTLAGLSDFVLVEADGSRGLPLKAHASHEPVIPENAGKTVCVVGARGLGKPIREVVHRPEIFCSICGAELEALAEPAHVAKVLNAESLADIYYVNQCDLLQAAAQASVLAPLLNRPVICGSLLKT